VSGLCIAAGAVALGLLWPDFTLAWTHSIEKTEWQEDYAVTTTGLELRTARVRGTGAGMEPTPDASLVDGWYVWQPRRPLPSLTLARSGQAGDYRLCRAGACHTLEDLLGAGTEPAVLTSC
jgi:hypothetical protein